MTRTNGLLLDTDVIVNLRSPDPHPAITTFLHRRRHLRIFVSALTIGELHSLGAHDDPRGGNGWLREFRERFGSNILPVDADIAAIWGPLSGNTEVSAIDSLIAATAIHKRLSIVSGNVEVYRRFAVPAINPWVAGTHPPTDATTPLVDRREEPAVDW